MTSSIGPVNAQSSFLPPEFDIPENLRLLRELISKRERLTATLLNAKENGQYDLFELIAGQQWFAVVTDESSGPSSKARYAYRQVFDMIASNGGLNIASGATVATPHKIPSPITPLRLQGAATTAAIRFLPLPYASAIANLNVEIFADNTNITIINGAGQPALTQCYIVFEYLKQ